MRPRAVHHSSRRAGAAPQRGGSGTSPPSNSDRAVGLDRPGGTGTATMAAMARVVIVGGGPGGYESALVAAQLGAEVVVVDSDGIGGSAVLTDCVPSKTLIATAEVMTDLAAAGELGIHSDPPRVDLADVNRRVKALALAQSADIGRRLARDGVTVVRGRGRLDGPGRVIAVADDGTETPYDADAVLIATGAAPRTLPSARPDGERILTWEQVYDLDEAPEHLIVVGSGSPEPSSPAPTRPSASRSPWSPPGTGCCPVRTPTLRSCSRTSRSAAG